MNTNWRIIKNIGALLALAAYLALIAISYAEAATTSGQAGSSPKQVTIDVEIVASVTDDPEETHQRIIAEAREQALLQVMAGVVDRKVLGKEKNRILKLFQPLATEYAKDAEVVSEEKATDGHIKAKATVRIQTGFVLKTLVENLPVDRIIVVARANGREAKKGQALLSTGQELAGPLIRKGYTIIDPAGATDTTSRKLVMETRRGNTDAKRRLAVRYMADSVFVYSTESEYSETTQEIYSAHAKGCFSVYSAKAGKDVVFVSKTGVKGFGSNKDKAMADAKAKLVRELLNEEMKKLPNRRVKRLPVQQGTTKDSRNGNAG